jgi:tryptophan-rich sensory protein
MNFRVIKYVIIFLFLNFAALAIGSIATSEAVTGPWYTGINKAPWTPPGWVFGAAWTSIMICYAVFMGLAYNTVADKKKLTTLYFIQWILNVSWNPIFFFLHMSVAALVVICALTLLIAYFFYYYQSVLRFKVLLVLPYLVWLLIASSLNLYVVLYN